MNKKTLCFYESLDEAVLMRLWKACASDLLGGTASISYQSLQRHFMKAEVLWGIEEDGKAILLSTGQPKECCFYIGYLLLSPDNTGSKSWFHTELLQGKFDLIHNVAQFGCTQLKFKGRGQMAKALYGANLVGTVKKSVSGSSVEVSSQCE